MRVPNPLYVDESGKWSRSLYYKHNPGNSAERAAKYRATEKGREVERARKRKRYHEDPLKHRNFILKRKYGITHDDYQQMLDVQNGLCAMCGTPNDGPKRFHIDHNHKTGKVRALLCSPCNLNLGVFEAHKEKMLAYLDRYDK